MFKVQPSPKINKSISKKKKFLEKADLYEYALKYQNELYLNVDFLQFGKSKGTLLLDEQGEIVPKDQALQPAILHSHFNNYIHAVINTMIPETRKSIKPYEEVVFLLGPLLDSEVPDYVQTTFECFQKVVDIREEQNQIIYKIRDIQNMVYDKVGYFTEEDLTVMRENCEGFNVGQFTIGKVQLESVKEIEQTIEWLKHKNGNHQKLIGLLEDSLSEKSQAILRKAFAEQTKDYHKNVVEYPSGDEGVEKYLTVYREIVAKSTEQYIIPAMRN
ncbi:hypothetical protein FIU87_03800 [Bacillus sp. THAF10]|uniref:hypothetical protein n=1 Tax=Bacillus sp. THAF10 TaxID=2587848 RepID=UPI001268A9BC|nr:hypothetical protein [Bacillus sp. THAF10]QFT87768.1 hypothetical protein FIU87_03800 [Bacillus sp. THAF10]